MINSLISFGNPIFSFPKPVLTPSYTAIDGGTVVTTTPISSGYTLNSVSFNSYYVFTATSGTRTFKATKPTTIGIMIVGGGGGGGCTIGGLNEGGGGGGGGGIVLGTFPISANTTYTITIGTGGTGASVVGKTNTSTSMATDPLNGKNSTFSGTGVSITAIGGGRGGYAPQSIISGCPGNPGGSGGGGSGVGGAGTAGSTNQFGILLTPATGTYQIFGNAGGSARVASGPAGSAGGGGAGGSGESTSTNDGKGKNGGTAYLWSVTNIYYAGGGGGASAVSPATGLGQGGGAGDGGYTTGTASTSGSNATFGSTIGYGSGGGGGGSGRNVTGGKGAQGVCYILIQ